MRITRPGRSDIALVALLLLCTVVPYVAASAGNAGIRWADYFGVGVLQIVPLLWRRAAPLPAFAVVVAGCFLQLWVTDIVVLSDVALFIAYYGVVVRRGWRWGGVGATVACGIGAVLGGIDWSSHVVTGGQRIVQAVGIAVVGALCIAVTGALAEAGRRRVQLLEQLRARAVAAERERDQQATIAAQAERTRIAREMHDVVAHALAVIVVQADGAGHALTRAEAVPPVARAALISIGDTARQALAETRALVGVLRTTDQELELAPAGTLAELPEVVRRVAATGRLVHLDTGSVDLAAVPAGIGLALLRVAQEAITNSLKHAGPGARLSVTLHHAEGLLTLTVWDDGRGGPGPPREDGSGLIGMRERVAAHDGRLIAGPRAHGGFEVYAQIPWRAAKSEKVEESRS